MTGDNILIGGFIITGNDPKKVLILAKGPSMSVNGSPVPGRMSDPTLELRDANGGLLAFNDNWSTNYEQIPSDFRSLQSPDSALRVSLPRGNYTAIVRAKPNSGGVALVEFYDLWR